jgi:hypothetical protein
MSAQFHNSEVYGYFENASEYDKIKIMKIVLSAMIVNSSFFWDIAPNSPLKIKRRF